MARQLLDGLKLSYPEKQMLEWLQSDAQWEQVSGDRYQTTISQACWLPTYSAVEGGGSPGPMGALINKFTEIGLVSRPEPFLFTLSQDETNGNTVGILTLSECDLNHLRTPLEESILQLSYPEKQMLEWLQHDAQWKQVSGDRHQTTISQACWLPTHSAVEGGGSPGPMGALIHKFLMTSEQLPVTLVQDENEQAKGTLILSADDLKNLGISPEKNIRLQ